MAKNIISFLKQLGYKDEEIHFSSEPEESHKVLLSLENKYKTSTYNFLNNQTLADYKDRKIWLSAYDTFSFFKEENN